MDSWSIGLVVLLAIGIAVIAYGAVHDRNRTRRAAAQLLAPPARTIPGLASDAARPHYVSELQARRPPDDAPPLELSEADRRTVRAQLHATDTTEVPVGFLSPDFVTDSAGRRAVLDEPLVVVCAGRVQTVREVLVALQLAARTGRALVLVAPHFAADVRATLEVNVIQRRLRLLAVQADEKAAEQIASASGAEPVPRSDLQAGYLPTNVLGACRRWIATTDCSFLVASAPADPSADEGVR